MVEYVESMVEYVRLLYYNTVALVLYRNLADVSDIYTGHGDNERCVHRKARRHQK